MQSIRFIIFSCCFLVSGFTLSGQVNSLKVKYSETIHFEIPEEVKAMGRDFPTSRDFKKILLVNGTESNYVPNLEDKDEDLDDDLNRRRRRRWMMKTTPTNLYINGNDKRILHEKDLFGKLFVIEKEVPQRKWKIIATEQRDILDYTCMKAEYQDTSQLITAWFTPQIPLSTGPDELTGLPGLVLAASIGEDRIILATEIIKNPEAVEINVPSDKKTITEEKYEEMRKEKMEERKAMWGRRR